MPAVRESPAVRREKLITKTFKKALVEKEWTVTHLAKLCEMDTPQLSRSINHPMSVKFETILMIAVKLGIDSIPIYK